ncbi:hypothetical protein SAMN05444172_9232 [Burkholderia sp. GAS332]|nr:hypothetical protein SAMN05444172_9232 [Burkholderia sp. GAS332]
MKHGLIASFALLATSFANGTLYACPEGSVDVAMVLPLDAGATIVANGVRAQGGALVHVIYMPSSPPHVWSFYPSLPNTTSYRDGRRARLHGDSFEWPRREDGK